MSSTNSNTESTSVAAKRSRIVTLHLDPLLLAEFPSDVEPTSSISIKPALGTSRPATMAPKSTFAANGAHGTTSFATSSEPMAETASKATFGTSAIPSPTQMSQSKPTKGSLLGLPGALRNIIYENLVADHNWVYNMKNPATPLIATCALQRYRGDGKSGELPMHGVAGHPLTQVCRQLRTEFSSVLQDCDGGTTARYAVVVNCNFIPLLQHLEDYPSLRTTCELTVYLQLSELISKDVISLLHWVETYERLSSHGSEEINYVVHGTVYSLRFITVPGAPEHIRESYLTGFSHGPRAWWDAGTGRRYPGDIHRRRRRRHRTDPMVAAVKRAIRASQLTVRDGQEVFNIQYRASKLLCKRYAGPVERQSKRQKLCEEGEWNVLEGFDVYGDKDEDYDQLLNKLEGLKLSQVLSPGTFTRNPLSYLGIITIRND